VPAGVQKPDNRDAFRRRLATFTPPTAMKGTRSDRAVAIVPFVYARETESVEAEIESVRPARSP
jgi:hypothetical protein